MLICSIILCRIMGVRVSPGEGSAVISVAPRVRPQGTSTPPAPPSLHTIDMKSLKIEVKGVETCWKCVKDLRLSSVWFCFLFVHCMF